MDLYNEICSYENLELAFTKARKRKSNQYYVIEFEKELKNNLLQLQTELLIHSYQPKSLKTFIIRDPKTRKISKSAFRDRIVHHALYNIIEPLFDKTFIYDSYANRKGKGALKAVKRFDYFKKKASKNNSRNCFVLKADIKHYFDNVDHNILINLIQKRVKDERVIWLIKKILKNHKTINNKGMPLGNLTSQFFANIYLDEIDQFIKHKLKAKHYIRYVDDFVILHNDKILLEYYKEMINKFLKHNLELELHPEKSKILLLKQGTSFLGFRIFYHYKLLIKRNLRKFKNKLKELCQQYYSKLIEYDSIYDFLEGWFAYSKQANTRNFRNKILKDIEKEFIGEISTKEINRYQRLITS